MKNLYQRLAATEDGARALASARLRYEILAALHESLEESGITQTELARRLGIRKSAVNQVLNGDGNMRISTLAEYLHAMGLEAVLETVAAGSPRRQVEANRPHDECDDDKPVSWAEVIELKVTRNAGHSDWDREEDEGFDWESSGDPVVEYRMAQV